MIIYSERRDTAHAMIPRWDMILHYLTDFNLSTITFITGSRRYLGYSSEKAMWVGWLSLV
jgi:hypothetical protein